MPAAMMARDMVIVFLSLVLAARFVMRIEAAAKRIIKMIFLAISGRVVSGLSMKVMPSTIRKKAMINLLRMIISTLFEMLSTFLMVLS